MPNLTRRNFAGAAIRTALLGMLSTRSHRAPAATDAVSVLDFRLPQDTDDTDAFQRAISTRRPVYAPASAGTDVDGAYLVRDVKLIAGVDLFGDGIGQTILRPIGSHAVFYCDSGGPDVRICDIRIRNLTLQGWVVNRGFAEHCHLLHLNGVQGVIIENVEFNGFQGDGLYLGSGREAGVTRHNQGITISQCVFDGVENNNRNGISVIDGETILIEGCTFKNCTRSNMPGAIDFEPDSTKMAIIRDIIIRRCRFINTSGNVGVIAFHIPPEVVALPRRILISDNVFQNYRGSGSELYFNVSRALVAQDPSMDVVINGNRGTGGQWIYRLYAAIGIIAFDNRWENYKQGASIGYAAPSQLAREIKVSDEFLRCGRINGVGIYVFNVSRLRLDRCTLIDCGNGSKTSYGICFAQGKSEFVTLTGLRVRSRGGKTRVAVIRDQLHSLDSYTNINYENDFGGLPAIDISKHLSAR